MRLYVDTSAAMKLLVKEPESFAVRQMLGSSDGRDELLSSWLLHTELHCAARRRAEVDVGRVQAVLDAFVMIDVTRADLLTAPVVGAGLRSQDALHLAVALRARADRILTYDVEQAAAAERAGIGVLRPS